MFLDDESDALNIPRSFFFLFCGSVLGFATKYTSERRHCCCAVAGVVLKPIMVGTIAKLDIVGTVAEL